MNIMNYSDYSIYSAHDASVQTVCRAEHSTISPVGTATVASIGRRALGAPRLSVFPVGCM